MDSFLCLEIQSMFLKNFMDNYNGLHLMIQAYPLL